MKRLVPQQSPSFLSIIIYLFYISTRVSPLSSPLLLLPTPASLPPPPSSTPQSPTQMGVKLPMGIHEAWHIKLRQDQAPPPCIKGEQDTLPQGMGSKESIYTSGTDPGPADRGHKKDQAIQLSLRCRVPRFIQSS